MTTSIATAEINAPIVLDLKPVEVNRPDMWSRGGHAVVGTSPRYALPAAPQALVIPPRSSWWHRVTQSIAGMLRTATAARQVRAQVRKLGSLDDRTLTDMGLVRSEIEAAVRNGHPRWQRPARRASR